MTAKEFEVFWHQSRDQIVRALALTLGDDRLAAEATDEAMSRAYGRWQRVSELEDPSGWVYRVARNWATSWLRKMSRRPTRAQELLDRAFKDTHRDIDLLRAVHALPTIHREVVIMRFYLDWPVARIGSALRIPVGTVKSRLHRALGELRDAGLRINSDA